MENNMRPIHFPSMARPKSILVATDLNDTNFLLPVAIEQARITGAMLWLLHVMPPPAYVIPAGGDPSAIERKEFQDAEMALARIAEQVRAKGLTCNYEVRLWYPVERITECIHEHGIDRLVVGTSSRGKLGKLFIGSVAEELIRTVDIPVCTVGPSVRPQAQDKPRRMIAALSLRHHPETSLVFAAGLAAELQAELTLLHVTEQDRGDEGIVAGASSKINELLKTVDLHPTPQIRIRSGEPAEEIIAQCAVSRPQWLILSAAPASILGTKVRNGVAYRVIAQAPCPTFTLHSGAKAKAGGDYREFSTAANGSSFLV